MTNCFTPPNFTPLWSMRITITQLPAGARARLPRAKIIIAESAHRGGSGEALSMATGSGPVKVKPPRLSGPVGVPSSSRHPHSKTEAHANGLLPTPGAGKFTRGAVIYLRLHNFL